MSDTTSSPLPNDRGAHLALQLARAELSSRSAREFSQSALDAMRRAAAVAPLEMPIRDVILDLERMTEISTDTSLEILKLCRDNPLPDARAPRVEGPESRDEDLEASGVAAEVDILSKPMELWVAGQYSQIGWQFQGVFINEDLAVMACRDATYFVAPAILNAELLHEPIEWPGLRYPHAEVVEGPGTRVEAATQEEVQA